MNNHVIVAVLSLFCIHAESINIIGRSEWGAQNPTKPSNNLSVNPPNYVVIHHSAGNSCTSKSACITTIKNIQKDHIKNRDFNDIGYNFLVAEDGNIYEGQGWGKKGSHSVAVNRKSIGICVIGTYTSSLPNNAALQAVKDLITYGVENNKIASNYKLLGHRQTKSTECPGLKLYDEIKKWSNWSSSL